MVGYTDETTSWIDLYDSERNGCALAMMSYEEALDLSVVARKPLWYNGYNMDTREQIRAINLTNGFEPFPWE